MSRVRLRRAKERADVLTWHQRADLRGLRFPGAFATEEERREAWFDHRDELLARRTRPGHRPLAFWEYEHPDVFADDDKPPELYGARRLYRADVGEWTWNGYLDAIRRSVTYLAARGLLDRTEVTAIRNPGRRADGELHESDAAALEGLRDGRSAGSAR